MALHVRYFVSRDGKIAIPPTSDTPCLPGYNVEEANTIQEVDRLQKRLQQQEWDQLQREGEREERAWEMRLKAQRSKLAAYISSCATSEYDKEFFRLWIQLKDEQRRKKYEARYLCDKAAMSYFEAREFDHPRNVEELTGDHRKETT